MPQWVIWKQAEMITFLISIIKMIWVVCACWEWGEHHSFCYVIHWNKRGLLSGTIQCCVEEHVAMFLHTIGHNERNTVISKNFKRSGETVSRYFKSVLRAIGELRDDLIRPPSLETPAKMLENPWWYPYFEVWSWYTVVMFLSCLYGCPFDHIF